MKTMTVSAFIKLSVLGLGALVASQAALALDADAAQALAKKNGCLKCHAIDKDKKGPSYKKIAAKLKGKPDAEATIIKSITTGPKVKFEDGTEEEHKIIDTKDAAALKNLAEWVLSN
jgi:cytochrome c